jgi:hypothetical protein
MTARFSHKNALTEVVKAVWGHEVECDLPDTTVIRDVCDAIGLRLSGQLRRLRAHPDLKIGLARFRVMTAGGLRPWTA